MFKAASTDPPPISHSKNTKNNSRRNQSQKIDNQRKQKRKIKEIKMEKI